MKQLLIIIFSVIITNNIYSQVGPYFVNYNTANSKIAGQTINAIAIDNNGNKWFGTNGNGVSKLNGQTLWTNYNLQNTDSMPGSGLISNFIFSISVDNRDSLWFGTDRDGISEFNGIRNWVTYKYFINEPAGYSVNAIVQDNQNNMWFGTTGDSLLEFDGKNWHYWNIKNSLLAGDTITGIATDKNNNIWFVSFGSGISDYNNGWLNKYKFPVWQYRYVHSIAIDTAGNKWFGTYAVNGSDVLIIKFDGKTTASIHGISTSILSIDIDINNKLWIGTNGNGLFEFDCNSLALLNNYNTGNSNIASDTIKSVKAEGSSKVWTGTANKGVSELIYCDSTLVTKPDTVTVNADYLKKDTLTASSLNGFNYVWQPASEFNPDTGRINYITLKRSDTVSVTYNNSVGCPVREVIIIQVQLNCKNNDTTVIDSLQPGTPITLKTWLPNGSDYLWEPRDCSPTQTQ